MSDLGSIEDLMGKKPPANAASASPSTPSPSAAPQQLQKKMEQIRLDQVEEATKEQAARLGVSYINLKGFPVNPEALRLVPEEQARALQVLPFLFHGDQVRLAATDVALPAVTELAFQIGERNKVKVDLYLVSAQSLEHGLKLYAMLPKIVAVSGGVAIEEEALKSYRARVKGPQDVQAIVQDTNTTDLVAALLAAALELHSSDIHIEAEENGIALRYRLDGILHDVATINKDIWKQLISRIKLVAGLKLNVLGTPQDGRFTIFVDGQEVDVRTSTLPTAYGESVVMRLLVPTSIQLDLEQLGFRPNALQKLRAEVVKPHGMIITTGPTGSGKTTTLYAILRTLNTPDVKIITLEDPVEYKLQGINQSQIDHSKDYTFSKGLRSILRQDPDIVLVGEIRDRETAETAIQASLTGHLLLSTLHTNDAAGAVPRFISMGVDASLLAPALRVVMAQRLVRKLCPTCKVAKTLTPEEQTKVQTVMQSLSPASGETFDLSKATFFSSSDKGCEACTDGYKGRLGIYEILIVNPAVEEKIRAGAVTDMDMRAIGMEQGMTTMAQDGVLKAGEGLTSLDEIFRVAD